MNRQIIILALGPLLFGCDHKASFDDTVILDAGSDTSQVIKKYPSGSTREIIFYKNNRPFRNVGLRENGDSIRLPQLIFVNDNKTMFAFFPKKIADSSISREVLLGIDSTRMEKDYFKDIFQQIKEHTVEIKQSTVFHLNYDLKGDSTFELVGVFKVQRQDSAYKYFPFKTRIK